MELARALARRRMTRAFTPAPVPADVTARLLAAATTAPSAGHTQGWELVVIEDAGDRQRFWELTSDAAWRREQAERLASRGASLTAAPVIVLPLAGAEAYLRRYSEPDKAASGLATRAPGPEAEAAWPVPYWLVDTSFATMALLLAATGEGLGALFFRLHRGEERLLRHLGVPAGYRPIGAVALGHRPPGDRAGGSHTRRRRPVEEVVHRGQW